MAVSGRKQKSRRTVFRKNLFQTARRHGAGRILRLFTFQGESRILKKSSYYNIFTDQGTAASRVFFRIVAKAVRMRESWPDVNLRGPKRPYESPSASLSFAAFDLCRLGRRMSVPVSSNRLDRQWWNGWSPKQIHDEERSI